MDISEAIKILNEREFHNCEYKLEGGAFKRTCSNGPISGPGRWRMITEGYLYVAIAQGLIDRERLTGLETAIRKVVTQTGDDLCWRDIYVELAKLVGIEFNPDLLPRDRMLRNCERFIDSLATLKPYSSEFERERAIAKYAGTWPLREDQRRDRVIFHMVVDLLTDMVRVEGYLTQEDVDDIALAVKFINSE